MDLKHMKVRELAVSEYQAEYDSVLFALKPKNKFCGKVMDVQDLPFINTRRAFMILRNGQDWNSLCDLFCVSFLVKPDQFWDSDIVQYYHARNFLIQEWKRVFDTENRLLADSEPKDADKWRRAGAEKLNKYSDVLPLDKLGQRYGIYPFDLGNKPYSEILYLIALSTEEGRVNYKYQTLK